MMKEIIKLSWDRTASGVYKAKIGENIKTLLDYTGSCPKLDAINQLGDIDGDEFSLPDEIKACRVNNRLAISVPYDETEKIFGFGLQYKTLNQAGKVLRLKTDHYNGGDDGRTHAPCPVYFSSGGYGVFFNTAAPVTAYVGTAWRKGRKSELAAQDRNTDKDWNDKPVAEYIEVSLEAGGLEIIVFKGGSLLDCVSRYNLYCGGGFLPPKWGLGFWYRFAMLTNQSEVIRETDEFNEHDIHIDVVGLEPGWQSKSYPCTYEWSPDRFFDPKGLCADLKERGTRVNLWANPYISPSSKLYKPMYEYSASHTVWNGIIPDYTMDEAKKILTAQHKTEHLDAGASGYKIDEVDGYDMWLWPDHARFPSGTDAEDMRQLYGVLMQKMTTEMYKENNARTYGLVRASNSGGCGYPYVIYNDRYAFDEYMTGLVSSGFSGVSWTPEIRHGDNASDWLRRFQLALFSPMLQLNSWASGAKPWSNAEVARDLADIIKFRRQLLPYLYNAYAKYCFGGIPPFRALALDYPQMEREITDELLIGDSLLAAFIRPNETERIVVLPEGNWYNFYTKEFAGSNTAVHYKATTKEIPLFVKEGGMILLAAGEGTLTVRCYGERGKCVIYDDDGESYDYERGAYNEILLEFDRFGGGFRHLATYIREKAEKNYTNFVFE
ncbi:MAG: DUF5110 domain-containing protein [Oscillospiraceae bacterium]|nr:DUF5110 domain-containing protein [Oscillospiraceae bacterium]